MYDTWLSWKQPPSVSVKSGVITVMSFWQVLLEVQLFLFFGESKTNQWLWKGGGGGGGGGLLLAWPSLPKAHVQKEEAQALLMTALLPALRLRLQAAAFGEFNLDKASARAAWM